METRPESSVLATKVYFSQSLLDEAALANISDRSVVPRVAEIK